MAIYKLVYSPDSRLRKVTIPVDTFDEELRQLIKDMFETMYQAKGVGLAATQIGLEQRIAVIDVTRDKSQQLVLINPEVIETRDEIEMQEGCLSVPGVYETVTRGSWAKIRAQDEYGKEYEMEGEGLLAEAMQHEIEHLSGKLFIDLLSPLKRQWIQKKSDKFKKTQRKL